VLLAGVRWPSNDLRSQIVPVVDALCDERDRLAAERDAEKARADKADRALQSLTPCGSEYVNDPERCVRYVRESRDMQHRNIMSRQKRIVELEAERDAARAEVERLRAVVADITPLAQEYAGRNPIRTDPIHGRQDPHGVHAWLAARAAKGGGE
jgi:hypothetical protein